MWGHIILFLLFDGIFRCVYVADVFLVRCIIKHGLCK